jgi:hypothetical protein
MVSHLRSGFFHTHFIPIYPPLLFALHLLPDRQHMWGPNNTYTPVVDYWADPFMPVPQPNRL